jgi:transposase InsO family protein
MPNFCLPKTCVISPIADHTNYLAFFTMGARSSRSIQEGKGWIRTHLRAVDKFTKWIEVKPAASITATKAVEFINEIMYIFGVPNNIINNNGTPLIAREFKDFSADSGMKINYASVSHPQSNGQVERSNGMILQGLKPKIFDRLKLYVGKWVKELPSVL